MPKSNKDQLFGFLGTVGGVLFMIGDCLLYIYPNRDTDLDIDPVFAEMPVWRFTVSALPGVIGVGFMLFGFQSLYAMTKKVCGRKMQTFALLGGVGAAGTALAHFIVNVRINTTLNNRTHCIHGRAMLTLHYNVQKLLSFTIIWEHCCPSRIRAYLTAAEAFSLPKAPAK